MPSLKHLGDYLKSLKVIYCENTGLGTNVTWEDFIEFNGAVRIKKKYVIIVWHFIEEIIDSILALKWVSPDVIDLANNSPLLYKHFKLFSQNDELYVDENFKTLHDNICQSKLYSELPFNTKARKDVCFRFIEVMCKNFIRSTIEDIKLTISEMSLKHYLNTLNILCEYQGLLLFDINENAGTN